MKSTRTNKEHKQIQGKDWWPFFGPINYMDRNPDINNSLIKDLEIVARGLFLAGLNTTYLLASYYAICYLFNSN